MVNLDGGRRPRPLLVALAFVLMGCALSLGACTRSGDGSGSTSPGVYVPSDPYHYRCTGNCQAGA